MSFLSEEQRKDLARNGFFSVIGSDGRKHRIATFSYSGNTMIDDGSRHKYVCAYPQRPLFGYLPKYDRILGQMLAIQTDVEGFLKVGY